MSSISHHERFVAQFLNKFSSEKAALEGLLAQQDTPEYRRWLAEYHPQLAKGFEQKTLEGRQATVHDLALAEAVVHIVQVMVAEAADRIAADLPHHQPGESS